MTPAPIVPGPRGYLRGDRGPGKLWLMYATPQEKHSMHEVQVTRTGVRSTTSLSSIGTLREPPPGQRAQSPRSGATAGLKARDCRKPLTLTVQFVGNGDCEWLVTARGKRYKFAGCENIHECLSRLSRATPGYLVKP